MEDLPVKAIVIGVSVFVTMAVISALMVYFNTAKGVVGAVNKGTNIAEAYDNIMNEDVFIDTLTGVQIRSLINKYVGSETVKINIVEIDGEAVEGNFKVGAEEVGYIDVNNSWSNKGIIQEKYLDLINPAWRCKVEKVQNSNTTTLKLKLNVDNTEED